MDCTEDSGTDTRPILSEAAPMNVTYEEAAERTDHSHDEVASEESFDLQLDLLTLSSFKYMNANQRKSPVQFVSYSCYGRGKSLEDLIVPRLPLIYQKLEAEEHVGPPGVSEASGLPKRKGRGRARLLQEQTEYMSSAPGYRSALSKGSAADCTMTGQDADGTYPTAADSFPKSKSSLQKEMPADCHADSGVFCQLVDEEQNRKVDKETRTGTGKKKKKIRYRSLRSFIETCLDIPRCKRTDGGDENRKQYSSNLSKAMQTPDEESAFSDAEDGSFSKELSIAVTNDESKDLSKGGISCTIAVTNEESKDLSKGGISCKVSSEGQDFQNEENLEKINKTNDISCSDQVYGELNGLSCSELVDRELAHDGSDAKHVSENKPMIYPEMKKHDEVSECEKVDHCCQRFLPSDQALAESTSTETESGKNCEYWNLPAANKDDKTGSKVVTKKQYSLWKLEGLDVIQVDNVPKNCTKELETLVANAGAILASEKKAKKGGNSLRFRLNSREACRWIVGCLHEADCIFPDTVLKCYLVEENGPSTEL